MLSLESDLALTIHFEKFMKYLINLFLLIIVIFVSSCEKKFGTIHLMTKHQNQFSHLPIYLLHKLDHL